MRHYTITISTDAETKQQATAALANMGRQTANLRLMPDAHLLVLRKADSHHAIIGWQGIDFWNTSRLAEFFSLHVESDYRGLKLSTVLEQVAAECLASQKISQALVRMDAVGTRELMEWRIKTGFWRELPAGQLGSQLIDLCKSCELYDKTCKLQSYLAFDVDLFRRFAEKKIAKMIDLKFPVRFEIQNDTCTYI